ncbi:hypothetical protein WK22_26015 [Burkholderia multivorans]|nr:hypothetical protein WK22_26015 [Burkholderia multivorans]
MHGNVERRARSADADAAATAIACAGGRRHTRRRETMTERDYEIADLSKELLVRIVQGTVANGATVDPQQCATLAVQCATVLIDTLEARSGAGG